MRSRGPLPSRHYQRWTWEERKTIYDMWRLIGMPVEDIAKEFGRTTRAVRANITQLNHRR
jgi:transposase-like protein